MKQKFTLLIALFSVLFLTNCSDDDGGGNSEDQPTGSLTAEYVDTEGGDFDWVASQVGATIANETIVMVAIRAGAGDTLTIILFGDEIGNYIVDPDEPQESTATAAYEAPGDTLSYIAMAADQGSLITVTEIDTAAKTLSGTFTLVTKEPFSESEAFFINGVFTDVPYNTDIDGGAETEGTMSASVDGQSITFPNVTASVVSNLNILTMSGFTEEGESINLFVPADIAAGTYSLGLPSSSYSATYSPFFDVNNPSTFNSLEGTLIISAHDITNREISGTFEFEAGIIPNPAEHVITNGSFDISY